MVERQGDKGDAREERLDYGQLDIEASPRQIPTGKADRRLKMKRTISFQDGHAQHSKDRHRRNQASLSESDYTDEDSAYTTDTDDPLEDEDDDDGSSTVFTEASDVSDEDEDDDQDRHRRNRKRKLVPAFISRRRERARQEERQKAKGDRRLIQRVYRRMPVLTGVIAPFSIMLEIPGFTSRWYVRIDPVDGQIVYRSNPIILDVGLAFSLASAIVANIAILGRFAERISPKRATLIAGLCLIFHDIINAVALITFGVVHAVNDGYTYSEAYWMTTAATVASLICTTSLIFDYVSTKNFRYAGSGLTTKQAQLVMVIMAFLAYISISAMIYTLVLPLPFLDAMYFMVETLATVGLGDISPADLGGRVALFFIAPGGIILLAVVVAISRQTILEEFQNAYKRRRALFKQKAAERKEEKRKNRHLHINLKKGGGRRGGRGSSNNINPSNGGNSLILSPDLSTQSMASTSPQKQARTKAITSGGGRWFGGSWQTGFSRKGQTEPSEASPQEAQRIAYLADEKDTGKASPEPGFALHRTDTMATTSTQLREYEAMLVHQRQSIEHSFKQFRMDLAKAERNEFWIKLGVAATLFACFWLLGAAIFSAIEGWTYFEGFYFVFVVFTSIGYGDFSPKSSAGRAFFIVWALFGVGTLTILFSVVSDAWTNRVQQKKLAGEKIKKKKSRWSRLARRIRGHRGRDGFSTEKKEDVDGEEKPEDPSSQPDGASEKETATGQDMSQTKGGGILLEPSSASAERDGVKDGSVEEELDEEEDEVDMSQLQLQFASLAMSFHRSALDFVTHNRSTTADAVRHVPELSDLIVRAHSKEESGHQLSEQDRARLLDAVEQSGDSNAVQSTHQWFLLKDFEQTLHTLVERSSTFEQQAAKTNNRLQRAKDEIEQLRSKLREHDSSKTSSTLHSADADDTPPSAGEDTRPDTQI